MQISRRLQAVSAMVTPGGRMADIGTDHAYIPIFLARAGKTEHAIAMDVNRGPLARAQAHIAQAGLGEVIETRLSDGLEALHPGEADSIVIAGMGGPLTVRILQQGREKLEGCRELILQPQSEIRAVRRWLEQNAWEIAQEDMVCEDGKFYPMMRAVRRGSGCDGCTGSAPEMGCLRGEAPRKMTETQLRYGPLLLRERHPVLLEFLRREKRLNRRILDSLEGQSTEAAFVRAWEVREELERIEEALAGYAAAADRADRDASESV